MLVHGVRRADELAYTELIGKLQRLHKDQLIKINSVTREPLEGTLSCRIPTAILNGQLEALAGVEFEPEGSRVMLCGNPGMVADCMEALRAKGLRKHLRSEPGHILQEIYK